jgi:phage replication initiation protein
MKPESGLRMLVDWVSVTFKHFQRHEEAFELLGIDTSEFVELETGLHGYKRRFACGHIYVLSEGGNVDMGVHIEMSGQGCREYESYYGQDWTAFFQDILAQIGKFTRLDIAIDDIRYNDDKPYFTLRGLLTKVRKYEVRSKFKKAKGIEDFHLGKEEEKGKTIYFGRESSELQIRFYEKNHERENADQELEEGLTAWNRTEIQLRRERAQTVAIFIATGHGTLGNVALGVLKHYISFVNPNDDTNKSRWPVSPFWLRFLQDVEKLRLAKKAPDATIERKIIWSQKQLKKVFASIMYAKGGEFWDWMVELIENGLDKLSPTDLQKIDEYQQLMQKIDDQEDVT